MIGIGLCVVLSIFHIVLSEKIPPHCKGPAPDVDNPKDCCKTENIFSDEDIEACGIEKPQEDENSGEVPDCSKSKCLLSRYSLMKDENTVNKEAMAAFLDEYVEKNEDLKDVVESVKELCLKDNLPGPPAICESNNITFCTSVTIFMNCPKWKDTDNCQKLKNHFDDCKKYYI